MVSVLPSHPANICRLALSAISRVPMDIHGESTWATHGTHRVPGRPQCSSCHGALAPKTQPVSVHAEGQYILRLDVKQCAGNGRHDYRGNVKKTRCQSAYAHRHCSCEELLFQGLAVPPELLLQECSPARPRHFAAFTLSTCARPCFRVLFRALLPGRPPGWVCTTSCLLKYLLPEFKDLPPILWGSSHTALDNLAR